MKISLCTPLADNIQRTDLLQRTKAKAFTTHYVSCSCHLTFYWVFVFDLDIFALSHFTPKTVNAQSCFEPLRTIRLAPIQIRGKGMASLVLCCNGGRRAVAHTISAPPSARPLAIGRTYEGLAWLRCCQRAFHCGPRYAAQLSPFGPHAWLPSLSLM